MSNTIVSLSKAIRRNHLLSTKDTSDLLRRYLAIQTTMEDRGSLCRTPLELEKLPLSEPLTRIDILIDVKEFWIQPKKMSSKPKYCITFKIKP